MFRTAWNFGAAMTSSHGCPTRRAAARHYCSAIEDVQRPTFGRLAGHPNMRISIVRLLPIIGTLAFLSACIR
jgi:hypothetical protein